MKLKTLSQDEIVLLTLDRNRRKLYELHSVTSQNNVKVCLKVLNECRDDVSRFMSHYLDELLPVTFTNIRNRYQIQYFYRYRPNSVSTDSRKVKRYHVSVPERIIVTLREWKSGGFSMPDLNIALHAQERDDVSSRWYRQQSMADRKR
ncbi:hypothetical protein GOODEAATRI_034660 [Goodea atripinnis]|uniref:Uncharacterized protein n=1 Tax=Goodea atripinnis TaxID=208336 RepID=A0ABV0NJH1_9TELE